MVGRFAKYAKRVITFAHWVMDACFVVNLLRVKGALHLCKRVCHRYITLASSTFTTHILSFCILSPYLS